MNSLRNMERRIAAFTLIELLVVISVIAVLSGLILGGATVATSIARRARVEAERNTLITFVEAYKNKFGSYPPDNPTNSAINPLFYELTGTIFTNGDSAYFSLVTHDKFNVTPQNDLRALFGRDGLINSSRDPSEVQSFIPSTAKGGRTASLTTNGLTFMIFGVDVNGPSVLTDVNGRKINPWNYVSTNPTNNGERYDLWMDVYYGGKTNRISNWSRDPQPQ